MRIEQIGESLTVLLEGVRVVRDILTAPITLARELKEEGYNRAAIASLAIPLVPALALGLITKNCVLAGVVGLGIYTSEGLLLKCVEVTSQAFLEAARSYSD